METKNHIHHINKSFLVKKKYPTDQTKELPNQTKKPKYNPPKQSLPKSLVSPVGFFW